MAVVGLCMVEGCPRLVKARARCKAHYEQWLADPANAQNKIQRYAWPEPGDMVALFQEHQSYAGVARALGRGREVLRDWLNVRPELHERCRAHLRQKLTPEQVAANARVSSRKWRKANPEAVKRNKRAWAGSRDPDVVRTWNRKNTDRRREQLAEQLPLTPEDLRLNAEWEAILLQGPCSYCPAPATTIDHIIPVNDGGTDTWDNKCGACQSCNSSKRDKSLLDFLLWRAAA